MGWMVKVVNPNGNLTEMNAAGLAMLEASSLAEVQQHTLLDFIVAEHRDAFRALHRRVMQGHSGKLEFEIVGRKGTRRWLETHAAPLRDSSGKASLHRALINRIDCAPLPRLHDGKAATS